MFEKIKSYIKNKLGIIELEKELNALKTEHQELGKYVQLLEGKTYNDINYLKYQYSNIKADYVLFEEKYNDFINVSKIVGESIDIGIDIRNPKYDSGSWAIICIHGKMDYVRFVEMNQSNIRDIERFLKQFEYSNRAVDTPHKPMFDFELYDDRLLKFNKK